MIALNLPEDLLAKITAEAERRGMAVEEMVSTAVREWADEHAHQAAEAAAAAARAEWDAVLAEMEAKGIIFRFPAPAEPVEWQPIELPGQPLSEIIIEERGER